MSAFFSVANSDGGGPPSEEVATAARSLKWLFSRVFYMDKEPPKFSNLEGMNVFQNLIQSICMFGAKVEYGFSYRWSLHKCHGAYEKGFYTPISSEELIEAKGLVTALELSVPYSLTSKSQGSRNTHSMTRWARLVVSWQRAQTVTC